MEFVCKANSQVHMPRENMYLKIYSTLPSIVLDCMLETVVRRCSVVAIPETVPANLSGSSVELVTIGVNMAAKSIK